MAWHWTHPLALRLQQSSAISPLAPIIGFPLTDIRPRTPLRIDFATPCPEDRFAIDLYQLDANLDQFDAHLDMTCRLYAGGLKEVYPAPLTAIPPNALRNEARL